MITRNLTFAAARVLTAGVIVTTPLAGQFRAESLATQAAGPAYRAGWPHRLLFGSKYRDLWTTPVSVPYLDLADLTPTTSGGRFQTRSLRFRSANGFLYGIRSVDKVPDVLPPELANTFIDDLIRDQTSAGHPAGAGIVAPLARAAGVLQVDPQLVVLPDDPRLGEFREDFAGMLGYFELRGIVEEGAQQFAGALEIIDSDDLFPMLQQDPIHQVDSRRFLAARLLDIFIGDWDRHRGQWGWARFSTDPGTPWVPVPEDRDQAFARYDGLFLGMARAGALNELANFGDNYPRSLEGLTKIGREGDMWFLVSLEKTVWDSVAFAVQANLTDDVIDAAVARMPAAYQPIDGEQMRRALRSRRDQLPAAADKYYTLLLTETEFHGTDAAELVAINRRANGQLDLVVTERRPGATPYFRRTYLPGETRELRLYLHEGDDRVVIRGPGRGIGLRIVGGGTAEVIDSSAAGGVALYAMGADRTTGPTPVRVDRRAYPATAKRQVPGPRHRDWGGRLQSLPWGGFSPDVGVFFGAGARHTRYGFRASPFANRLSVQAGWSAAARTGRADIAATFHRSNSRVRADITGSFNGLLVIRYHGTGNETALTQPDAFYRVDQDQYALRPAITLPAGDRGRLSFGPVLKFTHTDIDPGRVIAVSQPYGAGDFGQIGWQADFQVDTRDAPRGASHGFFARAGGTVYAGAWDSQNTFGEAHGSVSAYTTAGTLPGPGATLALRAGGKKIWGNFPFFEAAFLGDEETVRLGRQNRYAGDAAVWGNAELRLRLARTFILLPGYAGVLGIADAGRVFLDGESSNRWHTAFGGGIWFSFVKPTNALSVSLARSDERTGIYIRAGFAY